MITCKDVHVMATGTRYELLCDLRAITQALIEHGVDWPSVGQANAVGTVAGLKTLYPDGIDEQILIGLSKLLDNWEAHRHE